MNRPGSDGRSGYWIPTDGGHEILTRMVMGDLADEFADSLAEISASDPLLGGGPDDD